MKPTILLSKLEIPAQLPSHVPRPRLQRVLEHNLTVGKLTLVSAPAGYGKSTLLGAWARASRFPVAWLSLSDEEHDALTFLRYLLAAWATVAPEVIQAPVGLLLGSLAPEVTAVLRAFISAAEQSPGPVVFVLDDYHLVSDPAIHAAMDFVLEHQPPNLHFILAGRGEPPLALPRYRARGQLLELHADDLQFTPEECAEFLSQRPELALSLADIAALHAGTEGWIAGLQLAVLAARRRPPGAAPLAPVSGRQRFIADYLAEEVFNRLPAGQQDFLLKTSFLDRLCAPLCEAVAVGQPGQTMLERLERDDLFIVALDDQRVWFRYHQLLAEFLQDTLKRRYPEQLADLHRRAAQWYLAHDQPDPAFRHAVAAPDEPLGLLVAEKYFAVMLLSGEFALLDRWLNSVPQQWLTDYPSLGLIRAAVLLFTGSFAAAAHRVDEVEQRLTLARREDRHWQQARVTALRCFLACFQYDLPLAEGYGDQALRNLPASDLAFRADIFHALGDTYRSHGRWAEARAHYLSVLDLVDAPAFEIRAAHVFGALADLELRQGRLRGSATYWRKALARIEAPAAWGRFPLSLVGWVYLRLGEVLYEWNDLAEAGAYLARGLTRAELGDDIRATTAGYLLAVRLNLAQNDLVAAPSFLERARPLIERAPFPDWISRFERLQAELWLAQGHLRAATEWANGMLSAGTLTSRPDSEDAQLALVRVLLAERSTQAREQALALLNDLLEAAGAIGRTGLEIEALALQAQARWQQSDPAGAMTALERSMRLAEPEGYVRVFADLGLGMARLLQEARARSVMPNYVAHLLAAFGGGTLLAGNIPPEPLSQRELEVLALMAAGLTNREIAERLVISPETVKKHTTAIYGKLGVKNRTEAAARARDLDLLA
jgi:LuxR family maltose regulon positive regulatory protein